MLIVTNLAGFCATLTVCLASLLVAYVNCTGSTQQSRSHKHTTDQTPTVVGSSSVAAGDVSANVFYEVNFFIVYIVIFVLGILGNSLVIYVLVSSLCLNQRYDVRVKQKRLNGPLSRHSSVKRDDDRGEGDNLIVAANIALLNQQLGLPTVSVNNSATAATAADAQARKTSWKKRIGSSNHSLNEISSSFKHIMREKLTVTNFYLLNLAICDFIYLSTIPILLCTMYFKGWKFNLFVCKFFFAQTYFCQCSIVFILVILSVDRYLSVKYPHSVNKFRNRRIARINIAISYALSLLIILPVPIYTKIIIRPNDDSATTTTPSTESLNVGHYNQSTAYSCQMDWPKSWSFQGKSRLADFTNKYLMPLNAFTFYTLTLNYLLPVVLIVILYSKILKHLRAKSQSNEMNTIKSKLRSHRRIPKMIFIIIVCYIVCWTPYWFHQVFLYLYFYMFDNTDRPEKLWITGISNLVQVLCYMSSMLNPFIYSYMSEAFKMNLKHSANGCSLFCSRVCCPCAATSSTSPPTSHLQQQATPVIIIVNENDSNGDIEKVRV